MWLNPLAKLPDRAFTRAKVAPKMEGFISIPHGVAQVRRISWVRGVGPVVSEQEVSSACGAAGLFFERSAQQKTAPEGGFECAQELEKLT